MREKTRKRAGLAIKIGAGVLALVMFIGVILQGFMYF